MRVFVTGATGFIGEGAVRELIAAGHTVLGLARSDASAAALARVGVEARRGDLSDFSGLAAAARESDGVIHLAFNHDDFSVFQRSIENDRQAVQAMLAALAGTNKLFIGVSGSATLTPGKLASEDDTPPAGGHPRGQTEQVVLDAAKQGVRSLVVRFAPSVHGAGDKGFVPMLIDIARRTGVAAYLGEGDNRWPAAHRSDAGTLLRLAVEKAAPGTRLHCIAEEGVPMRAIAEAIGAGLGVPVRSLTPEQAREHFGFLAMFVGIDNPTSNAITRRTLDWTPRGPGLLEDMRAHYFG